MMRSIAIPSVGPSAAAAPTSSSSSSNRRKRTAPSVPRRPPLLLHPALPQPPPSHVATTTTTGKKTSKWHRGSGSFGVGFGAFSSSQRGGAKKRCRKLLLIVVTLVMALLALAVNRSFLSRRRKKPQDDKKMPRSDGGSAASRDRLKVRRSSADRTTASDRGGGAADVVMEVNPCAFRRYPPHRYYRLHDRTPDFLGTGTEYIYGEWPTLLLPPPDNSNNDKKPASSSLLSPHKICVNQSAWLPPLSSSRPRERYPFADGTNPSLLSFDRIAKMRDPTPETTSFVESLKHGQKKVSTVQYVATACMTNSQCVWGSPVPDAFSNETAPNVVLTTLLLLDEQFRTLHQATIVLKRDGPWGRMPAPTTTQASRVTDVYHTPALDDARLFVHSGRIWVSYREGKGFGYETQVLNPVHVSWATTGRGPADDPTVLRAEIWASETTSFCCGRNMALMESKNSTSDELLSLTWVDPVTVVTVDTTPHAASIAKKNRRNGPNERVQRKLTKMEEGGLAMPNQHTAQRKLQHAGGNKPRKSHVHGTNAFMVPLPGTNELLGMAHFHRPNDRKPNVYAKFGHHYTHALFTVSAAPPYELRRLSAEFVLPQAAAPTPVPADNYVDAEIIQFASGLEIVEDSRIIIAYGINDCEAAVTEVPLKYAMNDLLRPVKPGTQVVDVMEPLR